MRVDVRVDLHRCPGARAKARREGRVHGRQRRSARGRVHHCQGDEPRGGDKGSRDREPLAGARRLAEELQRPAQEKEGQA